ncbi:Hypothetical protein NTJ_04192 [Nesidiocoris tenuis]|uniref:Uncharacterized protein n=1 Tax=Nesidiocoris tenuis TaxID=355587 RepID=A0ABN7AH68_9HEMI|nr:Hypothetical protein NTJ_04192 [Nesidiocoris tenuis]
MSAQEAAYHALRLALSKSSRGSVFVNTSPQNERIHMLKRIKDLKLLDPESSDITVPNIFEKYAKRAKTMESVCLADFASEYKICIQNLIQIQAG